MGSLVGGSDSLFLIHIAVFAVMKNSPPLDWCVNPDSTQTLGKGAQPEVPEKKGVVREAHLHRGH